MDTPHTLAAFLVEYLAEALAACRRRVGRSIVAVGGIVLDNADGGLLVVAPTRVFRATTPFPREAENEECSTDLIGVEFILRVARCVPVLTESGGVPADSVVEEAHVGLLEDAAVLWRALLADELLAEGWERAGVDLTFPEPAGGIGAVEARVVLGLPLSDWCLTCPGVDEGTY